MKKSLIYILMVAISIVVLSSCSKKASVDDAKLELKLSDNLPTFTMEGHYTETKSRIELSSDKEVLWAYTGDDNSLYKYAYAFKWPITDKSLLEETKTDAKKYFPIQEPEVITCDFWLKPGDLEYAYYAGIINDNSMAQIWTFEDDDYFYQICVGYDLITYIVDGTNFQFSVPDCLKEVKSDSALMSFVDLNAEIGMQEFPNVEIYLNDGNFEFTEENIAKKWGVDNVKVFKHTFTDNSKNAEIPGYRIYCEYTENGKTMVCREDLVKAGDKYLGMEFSYDKSLEFSDYIENSYRAFLFTIKE